MTTARPLASAYRSIEVKRVQAGEAVDAVVFPNHRGLLARPFRQQDRHRGGELEGFGEELTADQGHPVILPSGVVITRSRTVGNVVPVD